MTFRKRRQPTPHFRLPPPLNPLPSQNAPLQYIPDRAYVLVWQVTKEDDKPDYVTCRGYDPETRKFYNEVNVAKPWDLRGQTGIYRVADMIYVLKCESQLHQTPMKAAESPGQPADLDEEFEILYDDDSKPIAWTHIAGGSGGGSFQWVQLKENLAAGGVAEAYLMEYNSGTGEYECDWETADQVDIKDFHTQHWGLKWERIRTVDIGDPVYLEVQSHGAPTHLASLTEDLNAGSDATCTITITGKTDCYVGGSVTDILAYDRFLVDTDYIPNGTEVAIYYDVHVGIWRVGEAPCS